jgi:hypothetical protein
MTVGQKRLPWAAYHGKRTGMKLHVAYSPELELPIDVIKTIEFRHNALLEKRSQTNTTFLSNTGPISKWNDWISLWRTDNILLFE